MTLYRWLPTDAVFMLRESLSALRVLSAGCPPIGGMVGRGKPSMFFSVEDMVGVEEYYPFELCLGRGIISFGCF